MRGSHKLCARGTPLPPPLRFGTLSHKGRGEAEAPLIRIVIARSEATKQSSLRHVSLDCFASLAMTTKHSCSFSRQHFARALRFRSLPLQTRGRTRPSREGAGKTGCALHPRSHVRCASKNAAHEHTGSAETLRPSLRNGFTTYTRSPWRPCCATIAGVMREHHADLTPALGRQDHAISPCAQHHLSGDTTRPSLPAPNVS